MQFPEKPNYSLSQLSNCIKILTAEAIELAQSGHPGLPLGFSQVMTSLIFQFLKFNPHDPQWFNRDRLVLSAGHGSMLLYTFFYLTGYKDFTLHDIKNFRKLHSKAAGHPEKHLYYGIETTTGPLGQGLANAVGMAIAAKKYQHRLGSTLCDYKVYVIVGDGCLMEGIGYEALSIAGHLQLDNLIILFDDNGITIDGKTDLSISENQAMKLTAMGVNFLSADGYDEEQIYHSLLQAQHARCPTLIAFRTTIGKGTQHKEGSEKTHGSPLGMQEINYLKSNLKYPYNNFCIADDVLHIWRHAWLHNKQDYDIWQQEFAKLDQQSRLFILSHEINTQIDLVPPSAPESTRISSGKIIEAISRKNDKIIAGSADLSISNHLLSTFSQPITAQNFSGNYIHYGIREHAMAAIMNGLALSGFSPCGGTFLVFSDYMRPAIRLAALMQLPVIFIMTHDSIGLGEDGPTHQPVEHIASFRAMPNINVFRPADFRETQECYEFAFSARTTPSIMVLTRQPVPQLLPMLAVIGSRKSCMTGGYIIAEAINLHMIDVTIFASGSEVSLAIAVHQLLNEQGLSTRVCSVPCFELLMQQGSDYLKMLQGDAPTLVAIEAASAFGWAAIIGSQGLFFGVDSFGASASTEDLYHYFALEPEPIAAAIIQHHTNKLQLPIN